MPFWNKIGKNVRDKIRQLQQGQPFLLREPRTIIHTSTPIEFGQINFYKMGQLTKMMNNFSPSIEKIFMEILEENWKSVGRSISESW